MGQQRSFENFYSKQIRLTKKIDLFSALSIFLTVTAITATIAYQTRTTGFTIFSPMFYIPPIIKKFGLRFV